MIRNRWAKRVLGGLLALSAFGGCKQQLFLEPGDYQEVVKNGLPKALGDNPHDTIFPPVVDAKGSPSTVLDPARPPRYITLKECIAIALEQGSVGSLSVNQFGFKNETATQFNGRAVGGSDAIRAFALDPAVTGTDIERSLSKFDARWITSMQWQKVDQPVAAQFLNFQQQRDSASFSTTLAKPLPTGGVAGITLSVDYSKFGSLGQNQQGFVNPNYTPRLQFSFDQPLAQLFGVEINQIASTAPQSLTQNIRPSGGQGVEGILITRIRYDQSRAEFEKNVNFLMVNVEAAYWNLYASYYALYAQEEGLRQAFDGYRFTETRVLVGTDPPQTLAQSRAQFEFFRAQVLRARGEVLEAERQLRGLLNFRSDEPVRLVPIDEPNLAPFKPDYIEAANEAIANRPELAQARMELKARQLDLVLQKNLRRPDIRMFGLYDVAGLGTRLDGPEFTDPGQTSQGNAFTSFANNQFNSWTIGLRMDMPLGFRDANALVRAANLNMTRSYFLLRDAELKALEYLILRYRRVIQTHAVLPPLTERRKQLTIFVEKTREVIRIGKFTTQEYFNLLQVQRDLADAINQEFRAVADYNTALAEFEFAKGTIQRYNNVSMAEGALPPWVSKRAADHCRERTEAAIKLRERPADYAVPAGSVGSHPVGPAIGTAFVGNIPPLTDMPPPPPESLDAPVPGKNPNPLPEPKKAPNANPMPVPMPMNNNPAPMNPGPLTNNPNPVFVNPNPVPPGPTFVPTAPVTADSPTSGHFKPEGTLQLPQPKPLPQNRFTPNNPNPPVNTAPVAPDLPPIPAPGGPMGGIPATLPNGPR